MDEIRQLSTPEAIFGFGNSIALIGWLILIFLPRRFPLLSFVPQFVIPFVLGLLYAGMILPNLGTGEGGFGSIEAVRTLFGRDAPLVGGWLHYLAFDLFIGAWIAQAADRIGLSRLIQAPILFATFMLGPIGLVLFLSVRAFYGSRRAVEGNLDA